MAKELARSIGARGRSKAYHKRGVWAVKAKNGGKLPVHPKKPAAKHAAAKRTGRFYAPEDVPEPLPKRVVHKPTKLRCVVLPSRPHRFMRTCRGTRTWWNRPTTREGGRNPGWMETMLTTDTCVRLGSTWLSDDDERITKQVHHHARNRAHPPCRTIQGKTRRVPEATGIRTPARDRCVTTPDGCANGREWGSEC